MVETRIAMNLREASRKNWGPSADKPTIEEINFGSLQRIADAVELMAQNFLQLQRKAELYKGCYQDEQKDNRLLRRRLAAAKGQITKLKKTKP